MKENTVIMLGQVVKPPVIKVNKSGEYVVGRIELLTVRRTKANEEMRLLGAPRLDTQYIISRNPIIIERRMTPIEQGDMVLVKGNMATRNTSKRYICPFCQVPSIYEGSTLIYIDPVYIEKVESKYDDIEEAKQSLLGKSEISNNILVAGNVCREPIYYKSADGRKEECEFQIAVGRKRRIIEDGPEKTTDFPFVKTYGKNSLEYSDVLKVGSEIFINGAVQAREIEMLKICQNCNEEFIAQGATMEIVPYSIEYGYDCNIPAPQTDDIEKYPEDEYEQSENDILSELEIEDVYEQSEKIDTEAYVDINESDLNDVNFTDYGINESDSDSVFDDNDWLTDDIKQNDSDEFGED